MKKRKKKEMFIIQVKITRKNGWKTRISHYRYKKCDIQVSYDFKYFQF